MYLKFIFLVTSVFCLSCSANVEASREDAVSPNDKSNNPQLGLSMFPSGLLSPDLKLPTTVSHLCKEDFGRYRNAILHPSKDTLWAYKSKSFYIKNNVSFLALYFKTEETRHCIH